MAESNERYAWESNLSTPFQDTFWVSIYTLIPFLFVWLSIEPDLPSTMSAPELRFLTEASIQYTNEANTLFHSTEVVMHEEDFPIEDDRAGACRHPIEDCPEDILKIIFELTVEDDTKKRPRMRQTMCLAIVSKQWRCIAVATPKLWNEININLNKSPHILASI